MEYITTLHTHGRTFKIVHFNDYYNAIEDKYIDEDGRLNTTLNGLQMCSYKELATCIECVKQRCAVDEMEAQGIDRPIATIMVVCGLSHEQAVEYYSRVFADEKCAKYRA